MIVTKNINRIAAWLMFIASFSISDLNFWAPSKLSTHKNLPKSHLKYRLIVNTKVNAEYALIVAQLKIAKP